MLFGMLLSVLGGVATAGPTKAQPALEEVQTQLDDLRVMLAETQIALQTIDAQRGCQEERRRDIATLVDLAEEHYAVLTNPKLAAERRRHSGRVIALLHERVTVGGAVRVCVAPMPAVQEPPAELTLDDAQPWADDTLSLRFDAGGSRLLKMSRIVD